MNRIPTDIGPADPAGGTAHRFGSRAFAPSLYGLGLFELKSGLGRLLCRRSRTPRTVLLHVGCGETILDGFENLDFYWLRFWKQKHIGHDFRFPLPYGDSVFQGAFTEHTLEHLCPADGLFLLKEIRRVLAPGSVLRVTVPDLKKYIAYYNGNAVDPEFSRFESGCEAIWSLTQYWGHLSCWDFEMLRHRLRLAGFSDVRERSFRDGSDARLVWDGDSRRWETLYAEARA